MAARPTFTAEESDPYCLPPGDAAALLFDAPWTRFAVVGDSLSAGTGDPSPGYVHLAWADRVANAIRFVCPDLAYLNTAENGATTAITLATQVDRLIEFAPDLLHVPNGADDIACADPDFARIERDLRRMYDVAADTGAQLTTFTLGRAPAISAYPDWSDRVSILNDITRTLAAAYGAVVVDMYDHPVNDRADLLSADRVHFSTSGQAVLAAEVVKGLAHLLESMTRV